MNSMFKYDENDMSTSMDDTGKGNYQEVEQPSTDSNNPDSTLPPAEEASVMKRGNKRDRDQYITKTYKKFNF